MEASAALLVVPLVWIARSSVRRFTRSTQREWIAVALARPRDGVFHGNARTCRGQRATAEQASCEFISCQTRAVGSEEVRELDDRWWLGLRGSSVESVAAGEYDVVVSVGGGVELTIERRAELADRHQPAVSVIDDGTVSASEAMRSLPRCAGALRRGLQDWPCDSPSIPAPSCAFSSMPTTKPGN